MVKNPQWQSQPSNRLWFKSKPSAGHQRVEAHRNGPQSRTQRVEISPGTLKTKLQNMICDKIDSWSSTCRSTPKPFPKTFSAWWETPRYSHNRAADFDLGRNLLLGINVSRQTETVAKDVLSGSENPQAQSKPSYKLWFATKSSAGHYRVEAHRNGPQRRSQRGEKPPGTVKTERQTMICDKIASWAWTCRGTPKEFPKTFSACLETQVQSKPSNRLWFRTKSFSGHQRVGAHRNISQKCSQPVEKFPGTDKT